MKLLKVVLVACSLSAAIAHAQGTAPSDANANVQAVAQANTAASEARVARHPATAPAKKGDECVGPASYCTLYFGS